MNKPELFSCRAEAGSRTYFFDIKATQNGTRYLVISESRQGGTSYEHGRVMVFEENIRPFWAGLKQAVKFIAQQQTSEKPHQEKP